MILVNVLLLFFARPLFGVFARRDQVSEVELMLDSVLSVILLRRFGQEKRIDGVNRYVETYRSRLIGLASTGMISDSPIRV